MTTVELVEYEDADIEVRQVYDDIISTRKSYGQTIGTDQINNFWKALAVHPKLMQTTWESCKSVMTSPTIDMLTKELIYIAVSVTNGSEYGTITNIAAARDLGMTDEMFAELMALIGMANQTNVLANGYQIDVDATFLSR